MENIVIRNFALNTETLQAFTARVENTKLQNVMMTSFFKKN